MSASLEDPFLIVQNEVFDALLKLRNNYTRWTDLLDNGGDISREDFSASGLELKNGIKSIQWDLDELEESLENSDRISKLDSAELAQRRNFIEHTREEVKAMNEKLSKSSSKLKPKAEVLPNLNFIGQPLQNGTKYTRLINAPDASAPTTPGGGENILFNSNAFDTHDDQKSPYVPDHSITMEEMDNAITVINSRPNRIEQVREFLHLTTERRQWMALGIVSTVFILIIIAAF